MNFVECWCEPSDFLQGVRLAIAGITAGAFIAGLAAISLATVPAYRDRAWSERWHAFFYAGSILQCGSIGISLLMVSLAALTALTEPELLLVMAILFGPTLIVGILAMPSWMKLKE